MPVKTARTSRAVGRPPSPPMELVREGITFRYLSGAPYEPVLRWRHGGFMFGPAHGNVSVPLNEIVWAADNGCFSQGDSFSRDGFLRFLDRWAAYSATCLFVVAPDVPFDHEATVERSTPYFAEIRSRGYVPALAIQEGATPANIPWGEIGCVFIAGGKPGKDGKATRAFKTSQTARRIVIEARLRDKLAHTGRCNSGHIRPGGLRHGRDLSRWDVPRLRARLQRTPCRGLVPSHVRPRAARDVGQRSTVQLLPELRAAAVVSV